jgi:hypothetical protein
MKNEIFFLQIQIFYLFNQLQIVVYDFKFHLLIPNYVILSVFT